MTDAATPTYRYTLQRLVSESRSQLPRLARNVGHLLPGLAGRDRIDGRVRVLAQLRMARLMGCPVCVGMFPPIARRAGLGTDAIRSALEGSSGGLTAEQWGAVAWVAAIVETDGEEPAETPEAAMALTEAQRNHLLFFVRMELVIHATGLMFLPHGWVRRARER